MVDSVITKSPYICAPNIMDTPDYVTKVVELDMTGADCIMAGSPISADGNVANDATAIGILLNDCHACLGSHRGLVVISGRVKKDVAEAHSGITISPAARTAMNNVTFSGAGGASGLPEVTADDAGKVLMVGEDGQWVAAEAPAAGMPFITVPAAFTVSTNISTEG